MKEIVKHINDTNASYRDVNAGDAKNTDLFLDNEHYELFKDSGEQITVRYNKENLTKAILFIASILPRKYDNSSVHKTISFSKTFVFDQLAFLDGFFTVDGVNVETRTQIWNARKDVPQKNGKIDSRFYFNGLLEDVSYTDFSGENKTAKFTIRNYVAGGYSDIHIKKASDGLFDVWITNTQTPYDDGRDKQYEIIDEQSLPLQQIFYGAPGTGKSHEISKTTNKDNSIRTTFHPDSDYSTFVGAYKPIEEIRPRYGLNQKETVRMVDEEKNPLNEKIITYNFVPQAFIKAYTEAWYRYAKWQNEEGEKEAAPETYYLIIEEINRGNCAQIFGDLFQLLDREGNGFSSYAISPDNDIQLYLGGTEFSIKEKKWGLKGIDLKGDFYNDEQNVIASAEEIISGELMLLPPNLFIWATMNTSDQSLFPIDSAFKRRWDWKYMPINRPVGKDYKILVNKSEYDWWKFIDSINDVVGSTTKSEDKKLGYFFCKAKGNIISADVLVSKAFFYLWNDVFRDYGFKNDIFKRDDNKRFVFKDFFSPDGTINESVAEEFVNKVINSKYHETPTIAE